MPQTTTTNHPTIDNLVLTFTEDDHKYVDNENREYKSVTTLVHDYFPQFDERGTAERIAERRGMTPDQLIETWHQKRDAACDYGTRVHEKAEFYITNGDAGANHDPRSQKEAIAFDAVDGACKALLERFDLVACEQKLFSPRYIVAGTADLIMKTKGENPTLMVLDWKTNEEITEKFWERGLDACATLTHCNKTHYALQLSVYQELIVSEGLASQDTPFKRAIMHIPPFSTKPVWVELPFLKQAHAILGMRILSK